ncbi:probable disease resistance protein RF45 [Salvia hispanica]|uniref:probable disease resistance protein RF45 n=1 Tax=Salvia hispanica TaxID=49212 RepID=UPI002009C99B|nr:probable disease resistance protein RF45 [Salvia hispanica]
MGGAGKTAIVRKVYNHHRTKNFFESFAWVCVSQECQIRSILEDVLKQLKKSPHQNSSNLTDTELLGQLRDIQRAKKCMVVIDDIWKTEHWDGLNHALNFEGTKTKILLTTRKQNIANIGFAIKTDLLNDNDGWELLKRKALPHRNIQDFRFEETLLEKIGKEMYKEDEDIDAIDICLMWIAQGMILHENHSDKDNLMDIAQDYLSELASRSVVEIIRDDPIRGQRTRSCKLHKVMRQLCLSVAKEKEDFGLRNLVYEGGTFSSFWHNSLTCAKMRHSIVNLKKSNRLSLEGLEQLETLIGFNSFVHQLESPAQMTNLRHFEGTVHDNQSLSNIIHAFCTSWKDCRCGGLKIKQGCHISSEEDLMIFKKLFNLHNLYIFVRIEKLFKELENQVYTSNLMCLFLSESEIIEDPMETLGKLPLLLDLLITDRCFLGEKITCYASLFPRLKNLGINDLPNLREWKVEKGAMPLVSKMGIHHCPRLEMVPDGFKFLDALTDLHLCGMPELGERISEEGGEDFHKVRHVRSIVVRD